MRIWFCTLLEKFSNAMAQNNLFHFKVEQFWICHDLWLFFSQINIYSKIEEFLLKIINLRNGNLYCGNLRIYKVWNKSLARFNETRIIASVLEKNLLFHLNTKKKQIPADYSYPIQFECASEHFSLFLNKANTITNDISFKTNSKFGINFELSQTIM